EATLGRSLTRNERAAVTKTAVLKTRQGKEPAGSVSVLHERWRTEAAALGWGPETLHTAVTAMTKTLAADRSTVAQPFAADVTPVSEPFASGVTPVTEPFALDGTAATKTFTVDVTPADTPAPVELAVLNAGRRRGVFSRADVTIEIAATLPVVAETAEQVRARVEDLTDHSLRHPQAARLGAPQVGVTPAPSYARFTSREVLQTEAAVLHVAAAGQGKHVGQVPAVDPELIAGLGVDQQAAVTKLTTGGDFLVALTAPAGAGKTTTLGA